MHKHYGYSTGNRYKNLYNKAIKDLPPNLRFQILNKLKELEKQKNLNQSKPRLINGELDGDFTIPNSAGVYLSQRNENTWKGFEKSFKGKQGMENLKNLGCSAAALTMVARIMTGNRYIAAKDLYCFEDDNDSMLELPIFSACLYEVLTRIIIVTVESSAVVQRNFRVFLATQSQSQLQTSVIMMFFHTFEVFLTFKN